MATKCKPQGPRFKNFGFWTKMAKVSKSQGPFWLLTQKKKIRFEKQVSTRLDQKVWIPVCIFRSLKPVYNPNRL
ncbi:hypothetical protein HanRHA438_Chr02g0096191 [Helianthus annuus]|nr:hypothetical protein HanRHA438_Chr02g0096191 [Helianthus annuus]